MEGAADASHRNVHMQQHRMFIYRLATEILTQRSYLNVLTVTGKGTGVSFFG